MRGEDDSGLIQIELFKNFSVVSKLWYEFAMTISLRVKVQGSRLIPIADYTPYLYALDHGRKDLTAFIAQREAGFTKRFIAMKCDALHRYEIEGDYKIDGVSFDPGVDHVTHHDYLIPHLCRSLEAFFKESVEEPLWDTGCTEEFLTVVNDTHCTSCSKDFKDLSFQEVQEKWGGRMVLFSDTGSNVCDDMHWISVTLYQDQIAIGNRGKGAGPYSGVRLYQLTDEMKTLSIKELIDFFQERQHAVYLPLLDQWACSCSRTSFEAAVLGTIYFILQKNHPLLESSDLTVKANGLWEAWLKFDRTNGLKEIIEKDAELDYDLNLLIRIFAVFRECSETSEEFQRFLTEEKQIDFNEIEDTHTIADTDTLILAQYVIQRDNPLGREWFSEGIRELKDMWEDVCGEAYERYATIEPLLEESMRLLPEASMEIEGFLSSQESQLLRQQCTKGGVSENLEDSPGRIYDQLMKKEAAMVRLVKFAEIYCTAVVAAEKKGWSESDCWTIAAVCFETLFVDGNEREKDVKMLLQDFPEKRKVVRQIFGDFPERNEALRSIGARLIDLHIDSAASGIYRAFSLPTGIVFKGSPDNARLFEAMGYAFAQKDCFDQVVDIAVLCAKRMSKDGKKPTTIGCLGAALAEKQAASEQVLQIAELCCKMAIEEQDKNSDWLSALINMIRCAENKENFALARDIAFQASTLVPFTDRELHPSERRVLEKCAPQPSPTRPPSASK